MFRDKKVENPVSLPAPVAYDQVSRLPESLETPNDFSENETVKEEETEQAEILPTQINLNIPFTSQAPHANWEDPYSEFCEEASTLMASSYIKNESIGGPDDADRKLLAIKDFEEKRFGYYKDTTIEETADILREYFQLEKVEVVSDPTVSEIKSALAAGRAVILPLAGREIGNPFFTAPGPIFHMLVVKGYTKDGKFITNDPGTRRGADYVYDQDVLMKAIGDWNGEGADKENKLMIVVG